MGRFVLLSAILLTVLSSCGGDTQEFVDRATLLNEPAARLRFPGSVELAHVGAERVTTVEGPQSAFDGYILGSDADADEIHSYYARELERLGWQRDLIAGVKSTAEIEAWGWCRGRIDYRLAIKDAQRAFQPGFYGGRTFRTVFDARLVSRRLSTPCPYAPSRSPTR